jgi:two-component system, LytTR family, response regulator
MSTLIKTLIVDDERLARSELKRLLDDHSGLEIEEVATYDEALAYINENRPQLVFLDIQLGGKKTGFDVLENIEYTPQVIFCTAYDEYAIKAFDHNALDYLLKPIDPKRLADAMVKFKSRHKASAKESINMLGEADQVFVKDGERCWFVTLNEVRLFESAGNYAKVYFGDNKPLILKSLNALEERLDEKTFFRANRKHIINLRWIKNIESNLNGGLLVYLKGGEEIEVSRRQAVRFKDMMSL